ncbi:unnamed protein product [Meloidogyne enterolobii]|uniref:Uncharacterized protein n=1 Tax=Meloidogyne enterolobii TaxID=390850 RepID=A0ACB0ZLK2_MELEN
MCDKDMCNSVIEKLNNTKTETQVEVATNPPNSVVIAEPLPPKPPATQNFAFGKYYGNQFLIIFMLIVGRWVGLHLQTGIGNKIKNI